MEFLFWICFALIIYCYFGYPMGLWLASCLLNRPTRKNDFLPSISVVISVWNEEDVIRKKISNLLDIDYPAEKMEIVIGSDGSSDHTNNIIRSFNDKRIQFLERKERRGKMVMLNDLVAMAKHDIVVFNDARQEIPKDAFRNLVANFADPTVGCVSGELIFRKTEGGTAQGINVYWEYEKFMRNCEAKIHSMLGATGAMYAIRRELFSSIPHNVVLDDMFVPFKIIEKGYRAIFDPDAKAFDDPAQNPQEEYRRKTRTLFGNFQIFQIFTHMFNPLNSPIAIQLISHKFLRILAPFLMILLLVVNLALIGHPFFATFLYLQMVFYCSAFIGFLAKTTTNPLVKKFSKVFFIPYVFCLLNFSVLVGFWRFLSSKQSITWEKARSAE